MNIAIYASGGGSNAKKIVEYFQENTLANVRLIVSNKKKAGVLHHAAEYGIATHILSRNQFYNSQDTIKLMELYNIDLIVLAGFLWLMPEYIIDAYPDRILNIHPSLLPKYGGKGMYGIHVHKAVVDAGESMSGMTIHLVNKEYDKGRILHQEHVDISSCNVAEEVAQKVLEQEHALYPKVIADYITTL